MKFFIALILISICVLNDIYALAMIVGILNRSRPSAVAIAPLLIYNIALSFLTDNGIWISINVDLLILTIFHLSIHVLPAIIINLKKD